MSLFSQAFDELFIPALLKWHGDAARYWPTDTDPETEPPIGICDAMISDEKREQRRDEDFRVYYVTTRAIQIVTDPCHCNFSGISNPQKNAVVELEYQTLKTRYVVESVITGDHEMAVLNLLKKGRVALGEVVE